MAADQSLIRDKSDNNCSSNNSRSDGSDESDGRVLLGSNAHYEMLKLHHMDLLDELQDTTLMKNLYQQQQQQQQQLCNSKKSSSNSNNSGMSSSKDHASSIRLHIAALLAVVFYTTIVTVASTANINGNTNESGYHPLLVPFLKFKTDANNKSNSYSNGYTSVNTRAYDYDYNDYASHAYQSYASYPDYGDDDIYKPYDLDNDHIYYEYENEFKPLEKNIHTTSSRTRSLLQVQAQAQDQMQAQTQQSNDNNNNNDDGANHIDPAPNKVCKNFIKQFLSGTTDGKDECEGLEHAYDASDCQSTENNNNNNNNKKNHKNKNKHQNDDRNLQENKQNDDDTTTPAIDDFFEEFQCCQVISTFYSSKCLYHQRYASLSLLGIVTVILLCSLTKTVLHSIGKMLPNHTVLGMQWLPEAGACIIVGAVVSLFFNAFVSYGSSSGSGSGNGNGSNNDNSNGNNSNVQDHFNYNDSFNDELFMYILLPPIIFQASLSIHKKQFTKLLYPIFMFAIFGTFVSSVLTGYIVHYSTMIIPDGMTETIPLLDAMLFGSLISSVDPVATLSILGSMGVSTDHILYVVVFGESILNDGVAIALFDSLKMHLEKGHGDDGDGEGSGIDHALVKESLQYFVKICFGSISIGIIVGLLCNVYFWLLRGKQSAVMEVATFFCFAFLAYYSSDGLAGCSGIVSIMTAGFIMDIYVRGYKLSEEDEEFELRRSASGDVGGGANAHGGGGENVDTSYVMTTGPRCCWDRQCTCHSFFTELKIMFSGVGHMSHRAKVHVGFVADVLANLMETAIFAYLGLFLFSNKKWDDVPLIIIGVLSCVLSRVVMVGVTSLFVNGGIMLQKYLCRLWGRFYVSARRVIRRSGADDDEPMPMDQVPHDDINDESVYIDRNMQLVLLYSGVRGAVSLALAENIPLYDAVTKNGSKFKPALKAMTSSSIIFTVFFFGASTYFTLKKQRERIHPTGNDSVTETAGRRGNNNGGVRGFVNGLLNRDIFEDDEAQYDLSLRQDNSRTNLTTSLLQNDATGAENGEERQMPPWMRPTS